MRRPRRPGVRGALGARANHVWDGQRGWPTAGAGVRYRSAACDGFGRAKRRRHADPQLRRGHNRPAGLPIQPERPDGGRAERRVHERQPEHRAPRFGQREPECRKEQRLLAAAVAGHRPGPDQRHSIPTPARKARPVRRRRASRRSPTDNGTYTCETSQQITDTTPSCTQTLVVDTSSTYTYACTNTYDVNARTWDISSACAALGASSACTKTGSSCTTPDPGQFKATQCTKGVEWTTSTQTCQSGTGWSNQTETCDPARLITVGTNYVYDGNKTWDGSTWQPDSAEQALQHAGSTCQIQATSCTASSQPQTYTCQTGYSTVASPSTCDQNLTVQTAPYWQYFVKEAGDLLGRGSGLGSRRQGRWPGVCR